MEEVSGSAIDIASDLLRIGAVKFSVDPPFTWTSGLRSPIYCDNRMTIGHVDVRRRIIRAFQDVITARGVAPEVIAGTATAGIPHAAWLAEAMSLPMVYVRSKPKAHGTGSRIEGPVLEGARVLVIEDLVSTGGSSIDAAIALEEAGFVVEGIVSIFTYGLPVATTAFETAGITLHSLTDIETLMDQAARMNLLEPASMQEIRRWKDDPQGWSDRHVKKSEARDDS